MRRFYRLFSDNFIKPIDGLFYYASFAQIWRFFLKCPFGFHEQYPQFYYPSCWVCGKDVFRKQYDEFVANNSLSKL